MAAVTYSKHRPRQLGHSQDLATAGWWDLDLTLALDWDYQRQSIQQEEQQRKQRTDEIDDSDDNNDDHDTGDEDDGDDEWWKAFEPPPELSLDLTKDWPESSTAVSQVLRDLLEETVKGARKPEAGAAEKMDDGDAEAADERNSPAAISDTGVLDAVGMTGVKDHDTPHTDSTRMTGASFESASTLGALRIEQRPTRSSTVETKASQRSSRWGFKKGKGTTDKGSVAAIVKMPKPVDDVLRKFFPKETQCACCLEDHRKRRTIKLPCQHEYCISCLRKLITIALHDESLFPPQCCTSQIPKSAIRDALSFSQHRDYRIRVHEFSTPLSERIYCPHRWCGAFIPPRIFPTDITHFECPTCFRSICRFCKQKIHGRGNKGDCPNDEHLNALVEVAEKRGWKRCFKCKAYVELTSGCDHMRCRCKAEFCYRCGAAWKTCNCNLGIRDEEEDEEDTEQYSNDEDNEDALAPTVGAPVGIRRTTHVAVTIEEYDSDSDIDDDPTIRAAIHASRVTFREESVRRQRERSRQQRRNEAAQRRRRREELQTTYSAAEVELDRIHDMQKGIMRSRHALEMQHVQQRYDAERDRTVKEWVEKRRISESCGAPPSNDIDCLKNIMMRVGVQLGAGRRRALRKMGRTQRAEETWFSAVVERRLADLRGRKGREEEELRDVSDGDGDETGEIAPKSGARSEYPHDEEDVWLPYRTYLSTFL